MEKTDVDKQEKQTYDFYLPGVKSTEVAAKFFKTPWEVDYTFLFGGDKNDLKNFMAALRMAISRVRSNLKSAGNKIPVFRIITLQVEEVEHPELGTLLRVTIQRRRNTAGRISAGLSEIDKLAIALIGDK